jgi:hypothetical protein
MASVSVKTDAEVDQLIADVRRMMRELKQTAESDKDAAQRQQARRWLDTLIKFTDYGLRCRGNARR